MGRIVLSNKRIAKNTFYMYLRFFITLIVGLYTSRVVLLVLGVSDFGLYSVVAGILTLFTFISTSLGSSTSRFLNYEMGKQDGDVNKVFNANVVLHFSIAFLVFVLGEIGGLYYIHNYLVVDEGRLDDAIFVFHISLIVACLGVNNTPYSSLISAKEKFGFLALVDITNTLIRLALIILLKYYQGDTLRLYAFIMAITTFTNFIVYRIYVRRRWIDISRYRFVKDKQLYKHILSFGWWNLLSTFATMARSTGSDLLINSFFGTAVNGAYAVSRTVSNYVLNATSYLDTASAPQIIQAYSSKDIVHCNDLTNKIGRYTLLLFSLFFFPIYIELEYILELWLKDVPEGVLLLTKLNLVLAYFSLTSAGLVTLINATGKIKWFKIEMSIFFILCIPAGYLLFKAGFPYYSIVILFIVADVINRIIQLVLAKHIIQYNVKAYIIEAYTRPLLIIIIMSGLILLYNYWGPVGGAISKLIVVLICLIVNTLLVFYLGMKNSERKKIILFVKNKIRTR